jgi:hypothetical protein
LSRNVEGNMSKGKGKDRTRESVIEFFCSSCGRKIRVAKVKAGQKGKCPGCKNTVVVPEAGAQKLAGIENDRSGEGVLSKDLIDPMVFEVPPQETAARVTAGGDVSAKQMLGYGRDSAAEQAENRGKRKRYWLFDVFLYPTSRPGLIVFGIIVGVPILVDMMLAVMNLLLFFPPLLVIVAFFSVIFLFLNITIRLYRYWYLFECVSDSADGGLRAPETQATTPGLGEMFFRFFKLVFCAFVFWGPLVYYLYRILSLRLSGALLALLAFAVSGTCPPEFFELVLRNKPVFFSTFFYGLFFFPMGLLTVIMFDSIWGLNPWRLVRSIFKTFFPYCGLILFFCLYGVPLVFTRKIVTQEILLRRSKLILYAAICANAYLFMVGAHLLGRFYWRYQEKLNWEV